MAKKRKVSKHHVKGSCEWYNVQIGVKRNTKGRFKARC